jgi:hypothetical protein
VEVSAERPQEKVIRVRKLEQETVHDQKCEISSRSYQSFEDMVKTELEP